MQSRRIDQTHALFRCFYRTSESFCRSSVGVLSRMELLVLMGVSPRCVKDQLRHLLLTLRKVTNVASEQNLNVSLIHD